MCGRYALKTSTPALARMFGVLPTRVLLQPAPRRPARDAAADPHDDVTSFNIAPTQPVVVCRRSRRAGDTLQWMRWGLIPSWSKDDRSAARMINARAETIAERPAFRRALGQRRCLVPASGFFEWRRAGKSRQPFFFSLRSGEPFAFAGIWERWQHPEGGVVDSCAIVTTRASPVVARVHERMPVIVPARSYEAWLAVARCPPEAVLALLAPFAPADRNDDLQGHPVSSIVNSARHDDPRCVEPLADLPGQA